MSEPQNTSFGFVIDCADPDRLAEFWSAALGYQIGGAAGAYVALYPLNGVGPKLLLQRVAEDKVVKNRMHLDIEVGDIRAEVDRLVALGARRHADDPTSEHGSSWIAMADPEGNEFCVCDNGNPTVPAN